MYLSNVYEYKAFVSFLKHNLPKNHSIKNQSLYEHCARAIGYKTDASLRVELPLEFDFFSFHNNFLKILDDIPCSLKYESAIKIAAIGKYGADNVYTNFSTAFPVTLNSGNSFYLNISFYDGFISEPLESSDDELNNSTVSEFYNNSFRINLGRLVTEQGYADLLDEITPLVDQVCSGYTYNGTDKNATFTVEAENALERLSFINVDAIEMVDDDYCARIWDQEDIYEYYSTDCEFVMQENGEVAFIQFGETIIMSNSSDDELKSAVESEIDNLECKVNLYDLINHFESLKNMCIEYKYKLLEETTSTSQQSL